MDIYVDNHRKFQPPLPALPHICQNVFNVCGSKFSLSHLCELHLHNLDRLQNGMRDAFQVETAVENSSTSAEVSLAIRPLYLWIFLRPATEISKENSSTHLTVL